MKRILPMDVSPAVERIANYYRHSRLYTNLLNTDDAYQAYIDNFTEDTKLIVEQGYSFYNKKEYLIAVDLEQFAIDHPEAYQHYFGCILNTIKPAFDREKNSVLFICAIGPSHDFFTRDTYTLVNDFVKEYGDDFTIFTDCPVEIDFKRFPEYTGSSLVVLAGGEYYRWSRRD